MKTRCMTLLALASLLSSTVGAALAAPDKTITAKDGSTMVLVPAGPFIMGSGEGQPDETPPHERDLPAYYIDVHEVTNAQYMRYLQATGATPPPAWEAPDKPAGKPDWPVSGVTWYDAMNYAAWAGKRLPTEAEWEKAARGTDGRRFPWGETPTKDLARLGGAKFRPVGSFPQSASPFGCMDMAGNAWEWTADWYDAYPGTNHRTVSFGRQYKVMRGGGTEYFYGIANDGRCAGRGRVLPFAGEDYLGFRCAKSVDDNDAPYDPAKLIAEAKAQLDAVDLEPVPLSYEAEYQGYLKEKRIPVTVTGTAGQVGYVRGGIPFPEGLIRNIDVVNVIGPDGKARPVQREVLTPWRDGSARWLLLDFPATAGEALTVTFGGAARSQGIQPLLVSENAGQVVIDTGRAKFTFTRQGLLEQVLAGGKPTIAGTAIELVTNRGRLTALPAEEMQVEADGPLRATVRLQGWMGDESGKPSPMRYDMRAHMRADSTRANILLTLTNLEPRDVGPRNEHLEMRVPRFEVADAAVRFALPSSSRELVLGTDRGVFKGPVGGKTELLQPTATEFTITRDGREFEKGSKSQGWAAVQTANGWLNLGMRHFWQNHAKAMVLSPNEIVMRLWAGTEPYLFEATTAKTHEFVLEVSASRPDASAHMVLEPLRLSMAPAWSCGTKAMGGVLLPRCQESIEQLAYWELMRESSMEQYVRSSGTGWRDFGDVRHMGTTKGANAYNNLEYDAPFNFQLQYLRTGHRWYLDAAEIQARHQGDIDTDHVTGHPYKHSPFHVTTYADIAHMFLRGLVTHYWLTGEQRSLENAILIGNHIAPRAVHFDGFGNERQIGWGTYALSGIYDATLDDRYLDAATKLCDKLVTEMSRHGKFNIRYDNRMSLMNGMAMNGMMSVQELTGDKKLADGILRLAGRTLGFYPEYALRTLHGYAWALLTTNDPRYQYVLDRTWQTCMQHMLTYDASTVEVHAWRFPWFAVKYQMFPLFAETPPNLPDHTTYKGLRLKNADIELFIRTNMGESAPVLVLMEGLATGSVELFDRSGKLLEKVDLNDDRRLFQVVPLGLPGDGTIYRLRLSGYGNNGWQIHYDARSAVTLYDKDADNLQQLCPKAYCYLKQARVRLAGGRDDVDGIKITFEAVGEGDHSVTLFDPDGNVYAAEEKYLPFEDKGRYVLELAVPMTWDRMEGWSLAAHQAKIISIEGFMPYFATRPDELFNPERAPAKR